jgi:hypothetical protein
MPLSDVEALVRARACLFATEAGYGFYPPGDENRALARAMRPTPGWVTLDLHGDIDGFTIDSGRLAPAQFGGVLRELMTSGELTVRADEGIRLISGCGAEHAARLAGDLGVAVLAPDGPLWTSLVGGEIAATACFVAGAFLPADPADGGWDCFGG